MPLAVNQGRIMCLGFLKILRGDVAGRLRVQSRSMITNNTRIRRRDSGQVHYTAWDRELTIPGQ